MKLFNRKTNTTSQDVQRELIEKQFLVKHLRHTYAFLNPDLDDEQINEKLLFSLTAMAEPQLLTALVNEMNIQGQKKLDEVTDLYENFFSDNNPDNNNNN